MVKIGIPRAFLYYRFRHLWEKFFEQLNIEYMVSPDTNKEIMDLGLNYAIDEACLSSKIYLGHVAWLREKCDYILVPRISSVNLSGIVCTKFQAIYDVVRNTFREQGINILYYNIDLKNAELELSAFLKMGRFLGKKKHQVIMAYMVAKQAEKAGQLMEEFQQEQLLAANKIKILIVAHRYNICDRFTGEPVMKILRELDAVPVIADMVNRREALARSAEISETLPWVFNRELVGAVSIYREKVDGIILMSTFPCGPDSLVNDILARRVKNKPLLNLVLDGQEGSAGLETRLESFIDIINFKRNETIG